jgi:hypothetical protein
MLDIRLYGVDTFQLRQAPDAASQTETVTVTVTVRASTTTGTNHHQERLIAAPR